MNHETLQISISYPSSFLITGILIISLASVGGLFAKEKFPGFEVGGGFSEFFNYGGKSHWHFGLRDHQGKWSGVRWGYFSSVTAEPSPAFINPKSKERVRYPMTLMSVSWVT